MWQEATLRAVDVGLNCRIDGRFRSRRVFLIRWFPAVFFLTFCGARGFAAEQQLDGSETLFSVMAAINAAGYDAGLNSADNSPVRGMVRNAVAAKHPASLADLKDFFSIHRQRDSNADLTQYISYALCLKEPPDFDYAYPTAQLPPDVEGLNGFQVVLAQFYKEMNLHELWLKAQPAFEQALERYHQPAIKALTQVNAYLRSENSGAMGTRFQVYIDLLAAPNQVQTRRYRNDYFIVVTPSAEPQADEIRHAYMHYQLDPLAIRWAEELDTKRSLIDYAGAAPLLEDYYRSDFNLLATECLIKAIEAKFAPVGAQQGLVDQDLREGYVVTAAFFDGLKAYEKQEQAFRFYYPKLVALIDLKHEAARLDKIEFVTERPQRKAKVVSAERKLALTGVHKTIEDAEQLYLKRDLENAKAQYLLALKQTQEQPLLAAAYYGLARIAVLQNDPDSAEKLFEQTLRSSPEPLVKAWAFVYLGRLADASGQREQAKSHYQSALNVPGGSAAAQQAAAKGLEKAFGR
jgi:predicted negative regulator of RcsB-dependent stress response